MIIAIQCASSKRRDAGALVTCDGRKVKFVARPDVAPPSRDIVFALPDHASDVPGLTWRQQLERLNDARNSSLGLLPAYRLYLPPAYGRLVATFGANNVFILSAGWGLVRADYLLPGYDITFSGQADLYKRRRRNDRYEDFMQLDHTASGPLVFLGGKDYLPLFAALTDPLPMDKRIVFRCDPSDVSGACGDGRWTMLPYRTTTCTNWHYGCADRLCDDPTFLDHLAAD